MANTRADVTVAMAVDGEDQVTKAINRVGNQMEKTAKATNKASGEMKKQFRFMRGGMGQLGYQVQDIAVQLQSGQNAMIVFGQQGSQIASIFGPQGAVIGAFLAVGAAIGTSLLPGLFKVNELVKESVIDAKALAEQYNTLSAAQQSVVKQEVLNNIDALNEKIAENQEQIEILEGKNIKLFVSEETLAKYRERNADKIAALTAQNEKYSETIDNQNKLIDKTSNYTEELIKKLEDERDTLILGARAMAIRKAEQSGATEENIKYIQSLYDKIEAEQLSEDATEKNRKRQNNLSKQAFKELSKENDRYMRSYKNIFDTFGDGFTESITQSENFAEAIKKMSKSVVDSLIRMLVQKYIVDAAFGVFESYISGLGSKGQMPTSSNPALNMSNAGSQSSAVLNPVTGKAYSQPSFAGGGFTGMGSRSGGVDGKGGFNAILHPNETVVDHENSMPSGVVINQTINVSTGVSQTVRAEIVNLMPQIAGAAKSAVADGRARGGSFGKALGA